VTPNAVVNRDESALEDATRLSENKGTTLDVDMD
jgi:hypothetical protein